MKIFILSILFSINCFASLKIETLPQKFFILGDQNRIVVFVNSYDNENSFLKTLNKLNSESEKSSFSFNQNRKFLNSLGINLNDRFYGYNFLTNSPFEHTVTKDTFISLSFGAEDISEISIVTQAQTPLTQNRSGSYIGVASKQPLKWNDIKFSNPEFTEITSDEIKKLSHLLPKKLPEDVKLEKAKNIGINIYHAEYKNKEGSSHELFLDWHGQKQSLIYQGSENKTGASYRDFYVGEGNSNIGTILMAIPRGSDCGILYVLKDKDTIQKATLLCDGSGC